MSVERAHRASAGAFALASVLMALIHSLYWLIYTAFVGINAIQSGFTNWCARFGYRKSRDSNARACREVHSPCDRYIGPPSPTPG